VHLLVFDNLGKFTMTDGRSENCSRTERDMELRTVGINTRNKLSKSRKLHFLMISANCTKVPRKVSLCVPHEIGCEFFKTQFSCHMFVATVKEES
jgi:hypothetical protein